MAPTQPLILTLQLDEESFAYFDGLRQAHFPAARNFLRAHLTLFHHLPPQEYESIVAQLEELAQAQPVLPLQVCEVKLIGRGVAFKLETEELQRLHLHLQRLWQPWLTPQDSQKLWPHVTVQNKVQPQEARALQENLAASFEPFTAQGLGWQLWEYKAGPWKLLHSLPFRL